MTTADSVLFCHYVVDFEPVWATNDDWKLDDFTLLFESGWRDDF